jgi:hypothetical protein
MRIAVRRFASVAILGSRQRFRYPQYTAPLTDGRL